VDQHQQTKAGENVLIPGPDTRVVELRVHGILGTTPEDLLDAVSAVDVAGDGVGRLMRPADRLRRPAPGPVLKAEGRPVPRTLEGYVWSAMTSGGAAKAIWALLFPFSLANVASWMLPPVREGSRAARALSWWCRALLRLAALLLTLLLVGQLAAASLDLFAAQCLAPGSGCLRPVATDWFRRLPMVRTALGLAPLLVALYVVNRVSRVNWRVNAEPRPEAPSDPDPVRDAAVRALSGLPGTGRVADPDAPALRALHLAGSFGVIAFLGFGGPSGPVPGLAARVCWTASLVLLGLTLAGALIFADPTGARSDRTGRWSRLGVRAAPRRALVGAAVLLALLVIPVVPRPAGPLPGTDPTLQTITLGLAGVCVLLGLLLVPAALLARAGWSGLPGELRPWAGGWAAAPFLILACFLGGGFGAGVGLVVRGALGGAPLRLPAGYAYLTLLWGIAGVLAAVGAALLAGTLVVRRWLAARSGRGVPPEVRLLHADRPDDTVRASAAWWWADWERRHAHRAVQALAAVLSVGALVAGVPWLHGVLPPTWTEPLSGIGLTVLVLLAGALLREVYVAARKPSAARHLGGLADLACFWPREAHPVVPPCYALKVVPELAARAGEYLDDPSTRVVLAGHSQGTVLTCAAMVRLLDTASETERQRLGMVVAGSPLQWAYPRAFPAVVPHDGLVRLYSALGGRWRALCRGTDPIGGGLTTWRRQVFDGQLIGVGFLETTGPAAHGATGALPAAVTGPTGAMVLGGDHWLPDPERGPFPGRRWAPGVRRHDDYYSDPEWDRAIACAAGLEQPTSTANQPLLFRLPGHRARAQ
jgi:hypothetical protein